MKTGTRMFLSSAAFGAAIASIYWYVSHETVGTMLLALIGVALLFVAAYIFLTVRGDRRQVAADAADAQPQDAAGEIIGPLPAESVWPIMLAIGVVLALDGLVYGVWLAVLGFIFATFSGVALFRESR
ncbi:MAG: cytochrome c oxidase subunit 4 [Candidatus Eremiobacteraeota bacterium]|nr:cytochrome c oxidase subunit 4 [Candidatus Eremiobacteraeota bacterium]MBC5826624.1 cytochrome c oxidase subunit 4 [Candidatus Eremiobacteraeota bacterium]